MLQFLDELDSLQDITPIIPIAQTMASHRSDSTTGIYATGRTRRKNEALKNMRIG